MGNENSESIEREVKLLIPGRQEYDRLLAVLGAPVVETENTDTFYDTADHQMLRLGSPVVRVRQSAHQIELTVKDNRLIDSATRTSTSRERSAGIALSEFQRLARLGGDLTQLNDPLARELRASIGCPLLPVGSIKTLRKAFNLAEGYVLELDKTVFPNGAVDYEIEMEMRTEHDTPQRAREILSPFLSSAGISLSLQMATGKYERFRQRVNL